MIWSIPLLLLTAQTPGGMAPHPFAPAPARVRTIDARAAARGDKGQIAVPPEPGAAFSDLDAYASDVAPPAGSPGTLPAGWVQVGEQVMTEEVAAGLQIDPDTVAAVEDIPGNEYPRKHTLYMNFIGADLKVGADNSALSKSTLAKAGPYPVFTGGEQVAVAAAQQMAADVAAFGIEVVYAERPDPLVPYTMAMIGGSWTDTNLEDSAGGVAPGTDCGALGQRHVVYVFASGGWGSTQIANVTAQEAGHAWGLDHSLNCGSVMSYCGGGNKSFSNACDGLCEDACQGPAGCRLFHEQFCGVGSDEQNEGAELMYLFGSDAPDLEAPSVEIVTPVDGEVLHEGDGIKLRAIVDDDFGGYAWKFHFEHDGEVIYDEIDFDREVDDQYRAAVNLVNLELGEYTLSVQARDHYDHVTTQTVTVHVEPEAADDGASGPGTSDGGAADGGTGDASDGTGGFGGDDDVGPSDDDDAADADSDGGGSGTGGGPDLGEGDAGGNEGCGCRQRRAGPIGALALLALLAMRRRGAGSSAPLR